MLRLLHRVQPVDHVIEIWVSLDVLICVSELILQLVTVLLDLLLKILFLSLLLRTQFLLLSFLLVLLCRLETAWILLLLQFVHASHPSCNLLILVDLAATHAGLFEFLFPRNDVELQLLKFIALCLADTSTLLFLWFL